MSSSTVKWNDRFFYRCLLAVDGVELHWEDFFFSLINVVHDLIKYFQTLELIILQHSTALLPTIKKNYFNINNCDLISCRTIHSTFFIFVFAIHKDVSMFECHFMHIQIFIVYSSGNAKAFFLNAGIWTFKFHSNLII